MQEKPILYGEAVDEAFFQELQPLLTEHFRFVPGGKIENSTDVRALRREHLENSGLTHLISDESDSANSGTIAYLVREFSPMAEHYLFLIATLDVYHLYDPDWKWINGLKLADEEPINKDHKLIHVHF